MRLDPGRRAAAAVGVAALIAVIVAGSWVALNRLHAVALNSAPSPAAAAARSAAPSSSTPVVTSSGRWGPSASATQAMVVIDVVGQVARPGIYRLPAGSRVDDAVRAAGGALAGVDLSTLNLAAVITDGEQIAVAVAGAPAVAAGGGTGAAAPGALVDLNTATAAQLDTLPGVGPVLAQHIVDWRIQHGKFTSIDQLRKVSGIGDAKFADLRALVTV